MIDPASSVIVSMPALADLCLADRILLVDDDAAVRTVMRRVLAQAGLSVTEARNSEQAALLLDQPGGFDILVTDIQMPGARDGVSLATDWRARAPGRPLLFVTGGSDRVRPDQLGPQEAMICKPFPRAGLVDAVRRLLHPAA